VRRFKSNISDLGGETLQCRQSPSSNVPCLTVELERLEAKVPLASEAEAILLKAKSSRGRVIECQLFSAGNAEVELSNDEQGTDHLGQLVSRRPNTSEPDPLRHDLETMNKRLKAAGAGS
jgi:hypothetical protein